MWTWFVKHIWPLLKKDFSTIKYDDETGFEKKDLSEKNTGKLHTYRGFIVYLKEMLENLISYLIIILFFFFIFEFIWLIIQNKLIITSTDVFVTQLSSCLNIIGIILILDALLQVAVLINSPGIDEIIDSVTVSLAGILLIFLGLKDPLKIGEQPEYVFRMIIPLSVLIVILLTTKHLLRKFCSDNGKCRNSEDKK
jgi:hypothetical protein